MKKLIGICLLSILVVGVAALPSDAATPGKGTLSKPKQRISWTGTFVASTAELRCGGPDLCDHFKLKINMGEGAKFRISLPSPTPVTDLDFYVYDPSGGQVASSGNFPGEAEQAEVIHKKKFRNKFYDIAVVPYLVPPGTMYTATATVSKYVK